MITSAHPVCVVIPVYTTDLSPAEWLSLDQCVTVLRDHPIVIAKPDSLDVTPLTSRHSQLRRESFRDTYFASVQGYNRMMLSDEFYARFAAYEFILIHQLDAFVFSDQLLYWCERGYDYIGAPWIADGELPNSLQRLRIAVRRKYCRVMDKQWKSAPPGTIDRIQYLNSTGNGGFSLRRVKKIRAILAKLHTRAEDYRNQQRFACNEDIFFSIEPNRFWHHLRIPAMKEASRFAWELNPTAATTLTGGDLPFGCHAWSKLHRREWSSIFKGLGYSLEEILDRSPLDSGFDQKNR